VPGKIIPLILPRQLTILAAIGAALYSGNILQAFFFFFPVF
jgi:hypothetical protein